MCREGRREGFNLYLGNTHACCAQARGNRKLKKLFFSLCTVQMIPPDILARFVSLRPDPEQVSEGCARACVHVTQLRWIFSREGS